VSTDLRNNRGNKRSVEDSLYSDSLRLISKAKSGDCQAFTALIEPHLRRIYAAAVKITKNHEDAEDACQESVLKAFLHIERYQSHAKFSTWLTRIAINEVSMKVRKMQREGRYQSDEGDLPESLLIGIRDQSGGSDLEDLCAQERKALLWEAIGLLR